MRVNPVIVCVVTPAICRLRVPVHIRFELSSSSFTVLEKSDALFS